MSGAIFQGEGTTNRNATFGKNSVEKQIADAVTRRGTTSRNATFGRKTRSRSKISRIWYDEYKRYVWKKLGREANCRRGNTTRYDE